MIRYLLLLFAIARLGDTSKAYEVSPSLLQTEALDRTVVESDQRNESFKVDTLDEWIVVGFDGGKIQGATLSVAEGRLKFRYRRSVVSPLLHKISLADFRELKLMVRSESGLRLALTLQDDDGAAFTYFVDVPANAWTSVRATPADFKLNEDSAVKKGVVDPKRITGGYALLDWGAVTGARGANALEIRQVSVERGLGKSDDDRPPRLPIAAPEPRARTFFMGFTPVETDLTLEAYDKVYHFIRDNADLIAHHFAEGVPWEEALTQRRYPPGVEQALNDRVQRLTPSQKIYVSATPVLREGLADYWDDQGQRPRSGAWSNTRIDDPKVAQAYLNFCRDLIRRFRPQYFNYGIEVNMLAQNPTQWSQFVTLARQVYTTLKRENPHLPVFVSLQIDEFWSDEARQREAIREILPYTDYVAVSLYPYYYGYFDPARIPDNYFSAIAELAPDKPFSVAETGFIAEDFDAQGRTGPGSNESQDRYMIRLLQESQRLRARFVIWFVPQDYDALIARFRTLNVPGDVIELYKVWKDCGLLDERDGKRPAYNRWNRWLSRQRAGARISLGVANPVRSWRWSATLPAPLMCAVGVRWPVRRVRMIKTPYD